MVMGVLPSTFEMPAERLQKAFVSYCFVSSYEMVKVGCLGVGVLPNTFKIPAERLQKAFVSYCFV